MLDARQPIELRRRGCIWLTMFPVGETAKRLAAVVGDPATPAPVRDQATWTLGYRQVRAMHPSTQWTPAAVQLADEALVEARRGDDRRGHDHERVSSRTRCAMCSPSWRPRCSRRRPGCGAMRSSASRRRRSRACSWCRLDDMPAAASAARAAADRGDARRGGAAAAGLARGRCAHRREARDAATSRSRSAGEAHLGRLEDALAGMKFADLLRQRAKWHLAHRGRRPDGARPAGRADRRR